MYRVSLYLLNKPPFLVPYELFAFIEYVPTRMTEVLSQRSSIRFEPAAFIQYRELAHCSNACHPCRVTTFLCNRT